MDKKILAVLVILFVGIGSLGTVMALQGADQNNANQNGSRQIIQKKAMLSTEQKTQLEEQRALMEEQRTQLETIFTSGTFEEFQAFIAENNFEGKWFSDKITAENWSLIQEMQQNMQRNQEILKQLGFEPGIGKGFHGMNGFRGKGFADCQNNTAANSGNTETA